MLLVVGCSESDLDKVDKSACGDDVENLHATIVEGDVGVGKVQVTCDEHDEVELDGLQGDPRT